MPVPWLPPSRPGRWVRGHADEVGAAVLAVLWLTGIDSGGVPDGGLRLAGFTVAGLMMTVPFAWRRRFPVLVALVVFASGSVFGALVDIDLPIAFVVAALAGAYSLGAYATGRRSVVTLLVVLTAVAILNVRGNDAGIAGLVLTPLSFVAVPWAIGGLVGRLRREQGTLRLLTARLERDQEELARVSVVDERARIARELHDIVAHSISVMVVQAGAAEQLVAPGAPAREPLEAIRLTGQDALVDMRRLLGVLRSEDSGPSALAPQPGLETVDTLVETARSTGLDVRVEVVGEPVRLPLGLDVAAYRLVQESLSNVRKHARASLTCLTLGWTPTCLTIEVCDDGVGAGEGAGVGGHGLVGMRERVGMYGGELDCGPQASGGWRVRARLPLVR